MIARTYLLGFALLWLLVATSIDARPRLGGAPALIERVTRTSGGLAAAQAIAALSYHIHVKEATYEVDGIYVVDRNGRMRIDLYSGDRRVYTECYDGTHAWQMDADGKVADSSATGTRTLWHGTQYPGQILALAELPAHGHRIESVGREHVDGVAYDVLKLTLSDGFETFRYVNVETGRIERSRDVRAPHPDVDPKRTLLDTAYSDFRKVDGVLRPFAETQTDLATGKWNQTATVTSIHRLPGLPDALFVRGSAPERTL